MQVTVHWSVEKGLLDVNLAENVTALPQPLGGNYEVARFNALRHICVMRFQLHGSDSPEWFFATLQNARFPDFRPVSRLRLKNFAPPGIALQKRGFLRGYVEPEKLRAEVGLNLS